jgi:hypothetical protein
MNPWIVLPIVAVVALVFVVFPVGSAAASHFRRARIVRCPLRHTDAAVRVGGAGLAEVLGRRSLRRVEACGLWSWPRACEGECLRLPDSAFRETRTGSA